MTFLLSLKSLYDRTPVFVLLLVILALLGYGYVVDGITSTKYSCDARRTSAPPKACLETFWSRFQ